MVRRRLAATLAQAVATLTGLDPVRWPAASLNSSRARNALVADFLQRANLTELAKLDRLLERRADPAQLELARGPALDDELLFESLPRLAESAAAAVALATTAAATDARRSDSAPISTRNLLIAQAASTELAMAAATNSTQEQVAYVSTRALSPSEPPAKSRGFFANAYKDALGKALTIVVGTGSLIFLLNLAIVLIIALRSARARRLARACPVDGQGLSSSPSSSSLPAKRPTLKKSINGSERSDSARPGKQLTFASNVDQGADSELQLAPDSGHPQENSSAAPLLHRRPDLGECGSAQNTWTGAWSSQVADFLQAPNPPRLIIQGSLGSPTWGSPTTSSSLAMVHQQTKQTEKLHSILQQQLSPGSSTTLSNTPIQYLNSESPADVTFRAMQQACPVGQHNFNLAQLELVQPGAYVYAPVDQSLLSSLHGDNESNMVKLADANLLYCSHDIQPNEARSLAYFTCQHQAPM